MRKFQVIGILCLILLMLGGCRAEKAEQQETAEYEETAANYVTPEEEKELALPVRYSYKDEQRLPKLRNQEGTNLCWAYAALSALECSKDEDAGKSFSVEHMMQYNPFESTFSEGGSYVVPMSYFLSWCGPVLESDIKESNGWDELYKASFHVQEVRQSEPRDFQAIKRFVYLYGGVESALYLDFDDYLQKSVCYNRETNAYCYLGEKVSNHDVVIIGWDDEYPKENFYGEVTANGAFICQNSWGEAFGEDGIFYVSYEDVNIGGYGIVYSRVEAADNYDRIYQSDLCGFTAQIGYGQEECWFANVYSANTNEILRACGFYATGKNTGYEIYLVSSFKGSLSFAKKKLLCKGELQDAGFYTIDFPEGEEVNAGEDFAVVVKIRTENAEYPVAIECPVKDLSEQADISDGRGYISHQGIVWEHVEETKNYNICLKVYSDLRR